MVIIPEVTSDTIQKRQVAFKANVKDIVNGKFIKEEGWKPNYVVTPFGNFSRVNVMAMIIAKVEDMKNYSIDDSTGTIDLRWFDDVESFASLNTGEIINVIGRVREYNDVLYILPEIIRKIDDPKWVEVRKKELEARKVVQDVLAVKEEIKQPETNNAEIENIASTESVEKIEETPADKIIKLIKEKDQGEGADTGDIVKESNIPEADSLIKQLLEEGDVFEIKPGKIKVLE